MPQGYDVNYAAHAHEMSGAAAPTQGMPPYPLYGIPTLGQDSESETAVPFYKKPAFCYGVGTIVGFGLGYAVFGFLMPKMKKNPAKTRRTTRKKAEASEESE